MAHKSHKLKNVTPNRVLPYIPAREHPPEPRPEPEAAAVVDEHVDAGVEHEEEVVGVAKDDEEGGHVEAAQTGAVVKVTVVAHLGQHPVQQVAICVYV